MVGEKQRRENSFQAIQFNEMGNGIFTPIFYVSSWTRRCAGHLYRRIFVENAYAKQ